MKCSDARARLSAYLDSELDAGSTFEVSRHIRSCPECAARFEEERRVDEAIGARLRGETLPDEAWTTIRLAVGASTRRRGRLVFAACAGVLSAVLLLGVGLRGFPWLQRIVRLGDRTPRVTWVEDRGRAEIAAMDDLAGAWIAATTGSAWRDSPDAGWVAAADPAAAAVELLQGAVLELCCEARGHATRLLATRRVAGPAGDALELRLECCGEPVLLRVVLSTVGPGQGFAVERAVAEDLRADAEERRVPDLAVVARRVGGVLAVAVARHPIGDLLDGLRVG